MTNKKEETANRNSALNSYNEIPPFLRYPKAAGIGAFFSAQNFIESS
jgi:hypothetical protein